MKTWKTCLLAASLAAFAFAPQAALAQAPAQHSKKANARKSATNQAVYNQAIAAVQKGDYATAFKILEPLAKKGDATAQHNLAVLYQDGLGTTADAKQALHWYEKSAAQGNKQAAYTLQQLEALEKNNGSLKTQMLNEAQKTLPNKK